MSVLREPLTHGKDEHISRDLQGGMWKKAGNPVLGLGGLKGGLWNTPASLQLVPLQLLWSLTP